VGLQKHDGYWLWIGGPVAPGASATTFGPLILIRKDAVTDKRLIDHELVHVRQWRELGVVGFLRRYLAAYFKWRLYGYDHWAAYRRIPLEVEAEWLSRTKTRAGPPASSA
jgi:hypothetical protein